MRHCLMLYLAQVQVMDPVTCVTLASASTNVLSKTDPKHHSPFLHTWNTSETFLSKLKLITRNVTLITTFWSTYNGHQFGVNFWSVSSVTDVKRPRWNATTKSNQIAWLGSTERNILNSNCFIFGWKWLWFAL